MKLSEQIALESEAQYFFENRDQVEGYRVKAHTLFVKLMVEFPDNPRFPNNLSLLCTEMGDYDEAILYAKVVKSIYEKSGTDTTNIDNLIEALEQQ